MICNGRQGKTGDIHGLEEIPLQGLMKGLESFGIVGKGNGMHNSCKRPAYLVGNLIAHPNDIFLLLHIADKHRTVRKQFPGRDRAFLAANHMNDLGSGLHQHPADGAGNGLFVGQPEDDYFPGY